MSQRSSRKRRRQRSGASGGSRSAATVSSEVAAPASSPPQEASPDPAHVPDAFERRYARSRAKDDDARAALKPLAAGERPTAVTIGAIGAAVLSLANLVALILGYNNEKWNLVVGTVLISGVLALVAWGMWQAKYWAVLGMQTLLGLTIVFAALGLLNALDVWALALLLLMIISAGTLFWFLVKAMARIQMPTPPSQRR